jgi:hypothetical protein
MLGIGTGEERFRVGDAYGSVPGSQARTASDFNSTSTNGFPALSHAPQKRVTLVMLSDASRDTPFKKRGHHLTI